MPRERCWRLGSETAVAALVLSLLVLVDFWSYGAALKNWWGYDDTQILRHALRYSPLEYFTVPAAWRALIPFSLTPWLTLAYDFDLALFGLHPVGFYLHSLLTIALTAFLLFLLARLWVDQWHALAGALLFLVGTPIAVASQELMVRHYVEGLFFFLLSLFLLVLGLRKGKWGYGWWAAIAFAIAASAKEIYLPLGLLALLLPEGNWRQRLRLVWPTLVVMVFYLGWRRYMLGDLVGGYTPTADLIDRWNWLRIMRPFGKVPALLLNFPWFGVALLFASAGMAFAMAYGRKHWEIMLLVLILPFLLAAPLIPMASAFGPGSERLFLALWAAIALGEAVLFGKLVQHRAIGFRGLTLLLLGLLVVSASGKSRQVLRTLTPALAEYQVQGMAYAAGDDRQIIALTPGLLSHYMAGLKALRQEMGRTDAPPQLVADEAEFMEVPLAGRRVLHYDAAKRAMVDITAEVPALVAQWRQRLRPVPLAVDIAYDVKIKAVRWQLGPFDKGEYVFLGGQGREVVATQGAIRMEHPPATAFRIRYNAPEGWIAYSPPLSLSAGEGYRVSWRGAGDLFPGTATP